MPVNSRNKGNKYERDVAKEWRAFGFDTKTSRYANRELDDLKVDLVNTGIFNIQLKHVERLSPSYHEILSSMPNDNNYNLIFHKRNRKGDVVVMTKEDFYDILQMLINTDIVNVR